MRMVKFCMLTLCATLLTSFAPQLAQANVYVDKETSPYRTPTHPGLKPVPPEGAPPPPPTHYTTPSGIMKHHNPQQEYIYMQQPDVIIEDEGTMMQQGAPVSGANNVPTVHSSPVLSKIDSANLSPEMQQQAYMRVNDFSAENDALYNELLQLKQQRLELERSAFRYKTPATRANIETRRKTLRQELMRNLNRQRKALNAEYGVRVTNRDLLMHRLYLMGGQQPAYDGQVMPVSGAYTVEPGYRDPQVMNPDYNQQYLRQRTMREAYEGQTYEQ